MKQSSGQLGIHPLVTRAIKNIGMELVDSNVFSDDSSVTHEKNYVLVNGTKELAVWVATDLESGLTTMSLKFKDTAVSKPSTAANKAYIKASTDKQIDAMVKRLNKFASKVS